MFELTPTGIKKTNEIKVSEGLNDQTKAQPTNDYHTRIGALSDRF
ncbi:MAG: hypothetical protein ACJAXB_002055 [Candidatus Endobugula sp.]